MKVILQQRVAKLGQIGDIVDVRRGYARNFLIPQGKALYATSDNLASFEQRRVEIEAINLSTKKEAESLMPRIEGLTLRLIKAASETGHLYGSVRPRDIVDALATEGIALQQDQIRLRAPVKEVGAYHVNVHLHPEVDFAVQVFVGRNPDDIDLMIKEATKAAQKQDATESEQQDADGVAGASEGGSSDADDAGGEADGSGTLGAAASLEQGKRAIVPDDTSANGTAPLGTNA